MPVHGAIPLELDIEPTAATPCYIQTVSGYVDANNSGIIDIEVGEVGEARTVIGRVGRTDTDTVKEYFIIEFCVPGSNYTFKLTSTGDFVLQNWHFHVAAYIEP